LCRRRVGRNAMHERSGCAFLPSMCRHRIDSSEGRP
jgi:hypothetical protein